MRPFSSFDTSAAAAKAASQLPPPAAISQQPRSPWHSPIPYLFGGLAAMLGLIAFALMILACSYWRLSGRLGSSDDQRDIETGDRKQSDDDSVKAETKVYEEKILVIMAGNDKPTFLATPVSSSSRVFSNFGQKYCSQQQLMEDKRGSLEDKEDSSAADDDDNNDDRDTNDKVKEEMIGGRTTSTAATGDEEEQNREAQESQRLQQQNH